MSMKIIGITGGIGAGKTSVSSILRELGAEVIDADLLSRQVVESGRPAYGQVVKEFGVKVLNKDGTIDRKALASIVFNNPERLRKLEAIIHAEVTKSIIERINSLKSLQYEGLLVLDVPIPVDHGFRDSVDTVWVVTADEQTRVKRIMKRSGLSQEEARQRIRSQMSQEKYMQLGDKILENEGDLENLRSNVEILVKEISGIR